MLSFASSGCGTRSACDGPCLVWLVTVGNSENSFQESTHFQSFLCALSAACFCHLLTGSRCLNVLPGRELGAVILMCPECALLHSSSAFMTSLETAFALLVAVRAAFLSSRLFWIGVGLE